MRPKRVTAGWLWPKGVGRSGGTGSRRERAAARVRVYVREKGDRVGDREGKKEGTTVKEWQRQDGVARAGKKNTYLAVTDSDKQGVRADGYNNKKENEKGVAKHTEIVFCSSSRSRWWPRVRAELEGSERRDRGQPRAKNLSAALEIGRAHV